MKYSNPCTDYSHTAGQDCTGTELIRYTMTTFLLTIDVSINGKRVSLTKDCSQLMLCCKSLKLSENFKTILPAIEGILQKNGVLQIGKCHGLPFLGIEIEFGTCEDMTSFLSCLKQMKACLLPPFRKHLVDRHEQAGRSVEMHLDLSILLLFQSKDGPRFATVNLSNCSQCFKILCAGELQYRSSTLTSETCSHPKSDVEFGRHYASLCIIIIIIYSCCCRSAYAIDHAPTDAGGACKTSSQRTRARTTRDHTILITIQFLLPSLPYQ